MVDLDAAYAHCARLASRHYENFPVASWLLPRSARPHVAALYAFARGADDLADEGDASPSQRLEALARWQSSLHEATAGRPPRDPGDAPVFIALAHTLRVKSLPLDLFEDLLSAFVQDVTVRRYESWAALLDYCRRSANPVGRLVLRICEYRDPTLDEASDALCTALQLTNFWQDLQRDWANGRLYLPEEEWRAAGARIEAFDPAALTREWRRALAGAVRRTQALFARGRSVCDRVGGRLGYELRLTWLGGSRILERLDAADVETRHRRPALGLADAGPLIWRFLTWQRSTARSP